MCKHCFRIVSLIINFEARDVICNARWASLSNMVIRLLLPFAILSRLLLVFVLEEHPIVPLMLLFIDSTGDVVAAWCINEIPSLTWCATYCCFSFMNTWNFSMANIHSTDKIARASSVCSISVNRTCDWNDIHQAINIEFVCEYDFNQFRVKTGVWIHMWVLFQSV